MFIAINTVAYAETAPEAVSRASTLYAVVQQLALSFGVTVAALLLQVARLISGPRLTPESFALPFLAIGAISLAGVVFFRSLAPETGAQMRGRPRSRS
jgi:ABC-type Fe3+-siderophore transport system permease subunit